MSERAARKGDREAMAEIGRLAVEASASMRGILWMVRGAGPLTLGDLREALGSNAALMLDGKEWAWEDSLEEGEALRELPFHRDVFLFFKEALHNLVRHSRATRVWLGFRVERGALRIEVRDNGEGFDPSADYPGSGLVSMRHRAQQLGARLDLDSGPGRGTRIQLRIPLS
jgi:signal transduction histidine kinase